MGQKTKIYAVVYIASMYDAIEDIGDVEVECFCTKERAIKRMNKRFQNEVDFLNSEGTQYHVRENTEECKQIIWGDNSVKISLKESYLL